MHQYHGQRYTSHNHISGYSDYWHFYFSRWRNIQWKRKEVEDVNKTTVSDISARTVTRMSLATVVTSEGMKIIRISGSPKWAGQAPCGPHFTTGLGAPQTACQSIITHIEATNLLLTWFHTYAVLFQQLLRFSAGWNQSAYTETM